MKKFCTFLVGAILVFNFNLRADEGMWLLSLLGKNYDDIKKAGLRLSPEDIYNVNQSCLKDAIVGLGRDGRPFWHFCTAEIVSDQGLMFTNHHCAFGMIQSHSSVEYDYLKDGFWAYSKDQELPNEGITASILVRMEDVSDQINSKLNDEMSEEERTEIIAEISKDIVAKSIAGTSYDATVKTMFNGNQFFLFVHNIYKDVRLVGAPPSSMGKFGGDTDNWMWPRHTCDFAMLRIYTAADGSPAYYSKDNVPLKPKHSLPVSIKGIKEGDYAMILGFPGTTDRFLTSYGLEETMNIDNKLRFEIRDVKINILREEMAASQATRIKYASKYASCSNYWKYSQQQNKALKNLNTIDIKREFEAEFLKWADGNKDGKYKEALDLIKKGYAARAEYAIARQYILEGLISGPELPFFAFRYKSLVDFLENTKDKEVIKTTIDKYRAQVSDFYKDYNEETEKRVIKAMFEYVYNNIDAQYLPDFYKTIEKKYKGDFQKYVDKEFEKSIFANEASLNKFLDNPKAKTLKNDPMLVAGLSIYEKYIEISMKFSSDLDNLEKGTRLFVDGTMKMSPKTAFYPDANSTLRLTYGNVKSYEPRDGVFYDYYTTIQGVVEKEDPNNYEFIVPQRLIELIKNKDFGQYADKDGKLPACFITNNDITGGNSGSPVINAEGHLIGHAFDGNSEAMSGDINFEKNLQRCINLDVRYTLFVIDKYAGAKNLIEELNIVK